MTLSDIRTNLPPARVMERLEAAAPRDTRLASVVWSTSKPGYTGHFTGQRFRMRIARSGPQFYATYLFGRVEAHPEGSVIVLSAGHAAYASAAILLMRGLGALLVGAALLTALQEPHELLFVLLAAIVAVGVSLLLWFYRVRTDDAEQLRQFVSSRVSD